MKTGRVADENAPLNIDFETFILLGRKTTD